MNLVDGSPCRAIAFYLPQFHPISENDAWWGEGFTEWTNVRKAKPSFSGHYQPHIPGHLGYYDLRDTAVRCAQAELAREHGIYGFCYYHYWFNGKRLLETPFNDLLQSGEPDFPFCLCWANENWTRRWDGSDQEILMEQRYSDEDSLNFISDLIPAFRDKRYIRVNGKPLLLVYRSGLLPDPKRTTEIWREAMSKAGVGDLYLVRVENAWGGEEPTPESIGFDAAMEFAPNWGLKGQLINEVVAADGHPNAIVDDLKIYDYNECMQQMMTRSVPNYKLFRGVFPSWDNSSRKKNNPTIFINSSPSSYAFWLTAMSQHTVSSFQGDERLVFINAWNEWGEGCHLEPDEKYGMAYLEATRQVLAHFSGCDEKMHTCENVVDTQDAILDSWLDPLCDLKSQDALVSVIMPAYNHEQYIGDAIESVLAQSYSNFELIIINDGSTDNTEQVILAHKDKRIKYYSQVNMDAYNTINRGISLATGEYISIINSDDVYHPDRLEFLVQALKSTDSVFACTSLMAIDGNSQVVNDPWYDDIMGYYRRVKSFELTLLKANIARTTSNFFFSTAIIADVGKFKPFRYAHDYDFILRVFAKYRDKVLFFPEDMYLNYRIHGENTISQVPVNVRKECYQILLSIMPFLMENEDDSQRCRVLASRFEGFNEEIWSNYQKEIDTAKNKCVNSVSLKICYILLHLPVPSETFVINEIIALQSLGVDIFPVTLCPSQQCHQELMARIINPVFDLSDESVKPKDSENSFYTAALQLAERYAILPGLAAQAALAAEHVIHLGVDHIHAHFATEAAIVALLVSKLTDIPFTFTAHAYDIYMPDITGETYPGQRVKLLVENATKVITVSEFNRNHILSITDRSFAPKLEVVHCGIDLERFKKSAREVSEHVTFLSVGRLISKKGHEYLLRAFKLLLETCDARLRIVGEGELLTSLKALALELDIADRVTFLGALSSYDVLHELLNADVFVLHSLVGNDGNKEGIPVSIMEACATGLPVVSTRHAGIPELIIEGVSGFLVEEKDCDSFAKAMLTLALSPEIRGRLGLAGHSLVAESFNLQHEAQKLKNIFTAIIDTHSTVTTKAVHGEHLKVINCYNCQSEERIFYAAENGYSLVKCSGCGLLYLEERPADTEISQAHKQGKHTGLKELNQTGVFNDNKVPDYLKVLNDIYNGNLGSKKKWLDIGCGHGEFIAALQEYSSGAICASGSEPNVHKQESARERGLNVGYFDLESHDEKYDVISLLNVYSHLPNPPEFIKSLKKNLNQSGEILIETGDTADFAEKDHYRPFYLPDHLSFASERIVVSILKRLGFEIVSTHKYPYPNSPQLKVGLSDFAREIIKAALPGFKSRLPEYFKIYSVRKRWSKTDMYIRARLIS